MIDPVRARPILALVILFMGSTHYAVDRMLLGVVQEQVKAEFRLSDFQLGLLGGPAFAFFYSILSLPVARLAEWANRARIVFTSVLTFSVMTAICGVAPSYGHLLVARIGVSIGESAGLSPGVSLVSDYFPPERRGTVMSVYAMGGPAGVLIATILGGFVAQSLGWRYSFLFFGISGSLVALLIFLLVKEPRARVERADRQSFGTALKFLSRHRSYVHLCAAGVFASFCAHFIMQYMVSFFIRSHGLQISEAGLVVGIAGGLFGMIGAFGGGVVADRFARNDPSRRPLIAAGGFVIATVALALGFWLPLPIAVPLIFVGAMCLNSYAGICFATISEITPPSMRATAIALFALTGYAIGYTLGPPIFGAISDAAAVFWMNEGGLGRAFCDAHLTNATCRESVSAGLRVALIVASIVPLGGAVHFWRSAKNMKGIGAG